MKSPDEITAKVLSAIEQWAGSGTSRKQVIGIDGVSAAGKSTLLDAVAKARTDVTSVELDQFLSSEETRQKLDDEGRPGVIIGDWQHSPWFRFAELEKLLVAYAGSGGSFVIDGPDGRHTFDLAKPVMVIEGTMLLNTPAADRLDHLVYLDMRHETSDRLRLERIAEEHRRDAGRKAEALRKQPAWSRMYRELFDEYLATMDPKGKADLVIAID